MQVVILSLLVACGQSQLLTSGLGNSLYGGSLGYYGSGSLYSGSLGGLSSATLLPVSSVGYGSSLGSSFGSSLGVARLSNVGLGAVSVPSVGLGAVGVPSVGLSALSVPSVSVGAVSVPSVSVGTVGVQRLSSSQQVVPVNAAIQSVGRTVEYRPVPNSGEPVVPQDVYVDPIDLPVNIHFTSKSSPINVQQTHIPGTNFYNVIF